MNNTINTALSILELLKQNGVSDTQKYEALLNRIAFLEQENDKLKEKIEILETRWGVEKGSMG